MDEIMNGFYCHSQQVVAFHNWETKKNLIGKSGHWPNLKFSFFHKATLHFQSSDGISMIVSFKIIHYKI